MDRIEAGVCGSLLGKSTPFLLLESTVVSSAYSLGRTWILLISRIARTYSLSHDV